MKFEYIGEIKFMKGQNIYVLQGKAMGKVRILVQQWKKLQLLRYQVT
jgi:hypothetical protein